MTQYTSRLTIPDEAFQLGENHSLGEPIATYRAHYSRSSAAFFFTQIVFLCLSLIVLLVTILIVFIYHTHNAFWLLYLIIALSSFNLLTITRRKNKDQPIISPFDRNTRIYVYQEGLIYIRNKHPVVVRWEQVRQVRYIRPKSQYGRTATVTAIYRDKGTTKRVRVGNILTNAELDALVTLLEQMYGTRKGG